MKRWQLASFAANCGAGFALFVCGVPGIVVALVIFAVAATNFMDGLYRSEA